MLEESLKKLEQDYGERFIRIHRNALVARHRLCGILKTADGRHQARLRGCDDLLEISRRHLAEVRAFLKNSAD